MRKSFPGLSRQLEILGIPVLVGCCMHPTMACAERQVHLPGYYGNVADILPNIKNPLPSGISYKSGLAGDPEQVGNTLTVQQEKERAVIHWGSFDIDEGYTVQFNQPSTSSKVLNRVTGNTPSQIYGNLNANGQVYIINQNGILFGPDSKINVHSLTASALNLDLDKSLKDSLVATVYQTEDDKFAALPSFAAGGVEVYNADSQNSARGAVIDNRGTITAGNLGSIFLFGQKVKNHGILTVPGGDAILMAGEQLKIYQPKNTEEFTIKDGYMPGNDGEITNFTTGKIYTDKGRTTMYGRVVNQNGLIRARTALEHNGTIKLTATEKVVTGPESHTETLISTSNDRKIINTSSFTQGEITIKATGVDGTIEHYGKITAPSGKVTLRAGKRVYLESGSSIDVSGTWVALLSASGSVNGLNSFWYTDGPFAGSLIKPDADMDLDGSRILEVQLNSDVLSDAYAYKNGPIKGEKVFVDIVTGLDFADLSGPYNAMTRTAAEMTTSGGKIILEAGTGDGVSQNNNGEVIVKQGATLDFSGGGIIYGDEMYTATMVRVGNKIYDLQNAPEGVPIDEVLGSFSKKHERYGKTDSWYGLYYGGSAPYLSYLSSYLQGADAGMLTLNGRKVIIDGTLNASVVRGIYQTLAEEDTDDNGKKQTIGRRVPRAGSVVLGSIDNMQRLLLDDSIDAIIIRDEVAPIVMAAEDVLPDINDGIRVSELSASIINQSGAGNLYLYPNQYIFMEQGVDLRLAELGEADFMAQQIECLGSVHVPSGTVTFTMGAVNTVGDINVLDGQIKLAGTIDASGRRLDNTTTAATNQLQSGVTFNKETDNPNQVNKGGTVKLLDGISEGLENAIILTDTSLINVNGGFVINTDNTLSAGNAGKITLKADIVQPGGSLTGLALEGSEGGELSIHTGEITIAANGSTGDEHMEATPGHLTIAADQYTSSGFTHLSFTSAGSLGVENGVNLTPSAVRLKIPQLTLNGYSLYDLGLTTALLEAFGDSSITLQAGEDISGAGTEGTVTVASDAELKVAPGGKIKIQTSRAGKNVEIAGTLSAPGGDITLRSAGELILQPTAKVDASGTSLPDWDSSILELGLINHTVNPGGKVLLSGTNITLESNSVVDVSGSDPVTSYSRNTQGDVISDIIGSAAGSVSVTYGDSFNSEGLFLGASQLSWLSGGSFSFKCSQNTPLLIREEDVVQWIANGFTDLSFSSQRAITFEDSSQDIDGDVVIDVASSLTLNGSALKAIDSHNITLHAPWLKLTNIAEGSDDDGTTGKDREFYESNNATTGHLTLSGSIIDIQGNIALSGFKDTTLVAQDALRLFDFYYASQSKELNESKWSGALRTRGNLSIQAGVVYPAMHHKITETTNSPEAFPSSFTLSADGDIEIKGFKNSTSQDIYSAGGRLIVHANNIDIDDYGALAAPMGAIELTAQNLLHLGATSTLSTRGDAQVLYGTLQDGQWTVGGYADTVATGIIGSIQLTDEDDVPGKSLALSAKAITQDEGAIIDASGGGSIFAYQFFSGQQGSVNPLVGKKSNRSVILPDNSVILPDYGTVYLEGTDTLAAGTYYLLPAEYAFVPGALIIEPTGKTMVSGQSGITLLGYSVVAGYVSDYAVTATSPIRKGFILRNASELFAEGNIVQSDTLVAGDAGTITITAGSGTSLFAGDILASALEGYQAGTLTLGAEDLYIGHLASLTEAIRQSYSPYLKDDFNLLFDIDRLQSWGLRQLTLGGDTTDTVILGVDSAIAGVDSVEVESNTFIVLDKGAQLTALATDNAKTEDIEGSLILSTNTLVAQEDTVLHATNQLTLKVDNLGNENAGSFGATIQVNQEGIIGDALADNYEGTFALYSSDIYLESGTSTPGSGTQSGAYLSTALQQAFTTIDNVELHSTSRDHDGSATTITKDDKEYTEHGNITFLGNVDLTTEGNLLLDGARIAVEGASDSSIHITAGKTLRITNDAFTSATNKDTTDNTISLVANTIRFEGSNPISFDTFQAIHFKSDAETIFAGTSGLTTGMSTSESVTFQASRYIADILAATKQKDSDTYALTLNEFTIDAGDGNVNMQGYGAAVKANVTALPGTLTVMGNNIALTDAIFDLPGRSLAFKAKANLSVANTQLLAQGKTLNFPIEIGDAVYDNQISFAGGKISLEAGSGLLTIDGTSTLDTAVDEASADAGLKGGTIHLAAATGGIQLGTAQNGKIASRATLRGDKLYYDTLSLGQTLTSGNEESFITNFAVLANTIAASADKWRNQFTQLIDIRARTEDVNIDHDITSGQFILTADNGKVDIDATIDASGDDGGSVEIWADNKVTLKSGGAISARAKEQSGDGGSVLFASANAITGGISTETGSNINVEGGKGGTNGTVAFRIPEKILSDYTTSQGKWLQGTIDGAAQAIAREFHIVDSQTVSSLTSKGYFDSANDPKDPKYTPWKTNWTNTLIKNWEKAGYQTAKTSTGDIITVSLVPELEVRYSGDMGITGGLTSLPAAASFLPSGTLPGVLTFRADGNLTVKSNIISAPNSTATIYVPDPTKPNGPHDSWDLNFIAGADLSSARIFTTKGNSGDFIVSKNMMVYTESGDITFAAAGNVTINNNTNKKTYMPGTQYYTLASFDGDITGYVGHDLTLNGGVIQTGISNISLNVGNDLILTNSTDTLPFYGTIRTIGRKADPDEVDVFSDFKKLFWNESTGSVQQKEVDAFIEGIDWNSVYGNRIKSYLDGNFSFLNDYTWLYQDGGDISLNAQGKIISPLDNTKTGIVDWDMEPNEDRTIHAEQMVSIFKQIKTLTQKRESSSLTTDETDQLLLFKEYFKDLIDTQIQRAVLINTYKDTTIGSYIASDFNTKTYSPSYETTKDASSGKATGRVQQGIVTMAGGNIDVTGKSITAQIGALSETIKGEVDVYATNELSGRFLANNGDMRLTALGNFGNIVNDTQYNTQYYTIPIDADDTLIESGTGNLTIQALGSISLGTINNPLLTTLAQWNLGYQQDATVTIHSAMGDVALSGIDEFNSAEAIRLCLLPGNLEILAAQDISLNKDENFITDTIKFYMAPAMDGQLKLIAGKDVNGKFENGESTDHKNSGILMSPSSPYLVYGQQSSPPDLLSDTSLATPLHSDDTTPVLITAGDDITNLTVFLPKLSTIFAEGNISELYYRGQNLHETDVSMISAGGDLIQKVLEGSNLSSFGIYQAGKGFLLVQAGSSIDLTETSGSISLYGNRGIVSTGNEIEGLSAPSSALYKESEQDKYGRYKGADIAVLAGYDIDDISTASLDSISTTITGYLNKLNEYDSNTSREYVYSGNYQEEITSFYNDIQNGTIYLNDEYKQKSKRYMQYVETLEQYQSMLLTNTIYNYVAKINAADTSGRVYDQVNYAQDIDAFLQEKSDEIFLGTTTVGDKQLKVLQDKFDTLQQYNNKIQELEAYRLSLPNSTDNQDAAQPGKAAVQDLRTMITQYSSLLTLFGNDYSALENKGTEEAQREAGNLKTDIVNALINPLLTESRTQGTTGDILIPLSRIMTTSGQSDLNIFAAGTFNIGNSTGLDTSLFETEDDAKKASNLGVLTQGGGDATLFAQEDINVYLSRVLTSYGGDIFMLSNHGDINAGSGSTTAVITPAAGTTVVGGKTVSAFKAPIPGSGIRTLTTDSDGDGPLEAPDTTRDTEGNLTYLQKLSLIAWEGVIDAGEAGIVGANLALAANTVLNAQNINASETSVGVPTTADAGPSLNALTGSTTVSDTQSATQSIGQQVTDSGKKLAESVSKMAEDLSIKMLVFKFEGFGGDSGSTTE